MGFSKIKGPLTSRIGRTVRFGAPQDVQHKGGEPAQGVIVDEVWARLDQNTEPPHPKKHPPDCWGDYSFCAQLIEWSDTKSKYFSIRLAYYRRRCGEDFWEFASQTTVNSDWRDIKSLCEKTLARTEWFQDIPNVQRLK